MDGSVNERKRGGWLSGWLIYIAFMYAWLAYEAFVTLLTPAQSPDPSFAEAPQWVLLLLIVAAVVNIVGVIALWSWRKVGLYLFLIVAIPLVIINLLLGVRFLLALFPLYSLSPLWILLQPRWKYFQ